MSAQTVEVWIDVACPWSRIGLVELDRAIKQYGQPVILRLRSLRIDPDAPLDYGHTTVEHLCAALKIDVEQAEKMLDNVREGGAKVGLSFNFDIARGGDTFDAHRLLHLAGEHDRQFQVSQILYRAHFEDGLLPSNTSVLRQIAKEAGLPDGEIAELFATDEYADVVLEDENFAKKSGITNTPTFFINDLRVTIAELTAPQFLAALKNAS